MQLHGHGTRSRSQRGPTAPGEAPRDGTVGVRRYQCKGCGQTSTVAPRGVVRRRLYAVTAIGMALALFGLSRYSPAAVREAKAGRLLEQGRGSPE